VIAQDLFARLQHRSLIFHSRHPVGDTMSRITRDSWCLYQFVDAVVFAPGHALLTLGLMVFLMGQLDWGLTLLALAVAPFIVGASFLIGKPLQRLQALPSWRTGGGPWWPGWPPPAARTNRRPRTDGRRA